jgi:predicted  nucleic acid-binding Zn-ribbon protein
MQQAYARLQQRAAELASRLDGVRAELAEANAQLAATDSRAALVERAWQKAKQDAAVRCRGWIGLVRSAWAPVGLFYCELRMPLLYVDSVGECPNRSIQTVIGLLHVLQGAKAAQRGSNDEHLAAAVTEAQAEAAALEREMQDMQAAAEYARRELGGLQDRTAELERACAHAAEVRC